MASLYKLHNYCLIIGVLLIGIFAVFLAERAMSFIPLATFYAFVTQMLLLVSFSGRDEKSLTSKSLLTTVLLYNLIIATVFYLAGYYYKGDLFFLDDPDAMFYYRDGLMSDKLGFVDNTRRILNVHPVDDWGILVFSSLMMSIVPSIFFMNAFYILSGVASSLMLFYMGKLFMPKRYAFIASMAYGTSSYIIVFHCTFLKESLFIFLVVSAMFCFYKSAIERKHGLWIGLVLCLLWIFFLRPVVVAFLVFSFFVYYAIMQRGSALSVFLYIIAIVGAAASFAFLQGEYDNYTGSDESLLAESGSSHYSGAFNFFMGWFVSLFGPFPTLFPTESSGAMPMNLYGAGLIYKAFLVVPFWAGVVFAILKWNIRMFPLIVFVLAEMGASAVVLASFELRKVVMHMPFMYVLSFYGIHCIVQSDMNKSLKKGIELASYVFPVGVLFIWTVIRVK